MHTTTTDLTAIRPTAQKEGDMIFGGETPRVSEEFNDMNDDIYMRAKKNIIASNVRDDV